MSKTPRPTDAELAILRVLWQLGPSTVRQVHDVLTRERPTAYTTALKLMQIMTEKGLVRRDESDRTHIYHPRLSRRADAAAAHPRPDGPRLRRLVVEARPAGAREQARVVGRAGGDSPDARGRQRRQRDGEKDSDREVRDERD